MRTSKIVLKKVVPRSNARRRGVVAVYVALTLLLMMGAASLAVDVGNMYTRRAQAQKAADAAALAAAYQLSFIGESTTTAGVNRAKAKARAYALSNSYDTLDPISPATVNVTYPVGGNRAWVKVDLMRVEPLFFARALGFRTANIGATAIATFLTPVIDIGIPSNLYGRNIANGASSLGWNYSIYGPKALHSYGDNISTMYMDNGQPNPEYVAPNNSGANSEGGFNFIIKNNTMSNPKMEVELYDPDCFNTNDTHDEQTNYADAFDNNVDELHSSPWLAGAERKTITQYSLYSDNGTPNDFTDDILVSRYESNNTGDTDLKWMTPPGFSFNKAAYAVAGKTVNYRMNVATLSGASENGFSVRAGPPHTVAGGAPSPTAFSASNGTSVAIRGILPVNFNKDGAADFPLGSVPSSARGGTLTISKFDTDVFSGTANKVYYTCSAYGSRRFGGTIDMTDDAYTNDTIALDVNYPGGDWTAHYTAGWGDTSTWAISVSGSSPGSISLVR